MPLWVILILKIYLINIWCPGKGHPGVILVIITVYDGLIAVRLH